MRTGRLGRGSASSGAWGCLGGQTRRRNLSRSLLGFVDVLDVLFVQEESLLLVQEADLRLVQEGDSLPF